MGHYAVYWRQDRLFRQGRRCSGISLPMIPRYTVAWNAAAPVSHYILESVMLRKSHHIGVILICVCIIFLVPLQEVQGGPILIRFSHVVGEKTPKGLGAEMFRDLVEQRLAGKVRVEIYPRSEKFTDEQAILGLMFGDVEMAAPSFPKFRKFTTKLQVFDLPFLFENVEHVERFQQSHAGKMLLSSMESKGIRGLHYWDNGMRVISANKPLRTSSDFRGLTFRIEPSDVFQQQYEKLGAIAIPMPFKRLPDALRGDVVDGYENAWSNILSHKMHLLRPFFTEAGHSYLGYMLVTNTTFWDKLPQDIRSELNDILSEVTIEVNRLAKEKESANKQLIMQESKVQVITLSDAEKQTIKDATIPVWDEFESAIGYEIIQAAIKTKVKKD